MSGRVPKTDLLKELKADQERNSASRMDFVRKHAEWLKSVPNRKWSKQQKEIID